MRRFWLAYDARLFARIFLVGVFHREAIVMRARAHQRDPRNTVSPFKHGSIKYLERKSSDFAILVKESVSQTEARYRHF